MYCRPLSPVFLLVALAFSACSITSISEDPPKDSSAYWTGRGLPAIYLEATGAYDSDGTAIQKMRLFENASAIWADPSISGSVPAFLSTESPLFDGWAGLAIRGESSQSSPKKAFALELKTTSSGEAVLNSSLLDFPSENDFVLHAAAFDRSLLRNFMAYSLSSATGRYAPRVHFVELYGTQLDGTTSTSYQGVYLLTEKLKIDKNRVAIDKLTADDNSGEAVTGGYLLRVDKGSGDYYLGTATANLSVHDPASDELTDAQKAYITGFFQELEAAAQGGTTKWKDYIDQASFIDFMLVNEITLNIDGYRLSSYLYKPRGGKLMAGPVWDFDIAEGNDWRDYDPTDGNTSYAWMILRQLDPDWSDFYPPFWWKTMLCDTSFRSAVKARWQELRAGPWSGSAIADLLSKGRAEFEGAIDREFQVWPRLTSDSGYGLGMLSLPWSAKDSSEYTYEDHYQYLVDWLEKRVAWMDSAPAWKALDDWALDQ